MANKNASCSHQIFLITHINETLAGALASSNRVLNSHLLCQEAEFKLRMVIGFWNVLDLLAFFPPLLEACLLHGANVPFKLGRFDLRWFKILRSVSSKFQVSTAANLKELAKLGLFGVEDEQSILNCSFCHTLRCCHHIYKASRVGCRSNLSNLGRLSTFQVDISGSKNF